MLSKPDHLLDFSPTRGVELALLLLALLGFWEFTLSSWPFQSREFSDLWPLLQDNDELRGFLSAANQFSSSNSRILEIIPTLIAEACFVSYVLNKRKLFIFFGLLALSLFAATLHLTNFTHANHPYYDFFILAAMVAAPGSLPSLRMVYAVTYFVCSLLKLNAGWITGSFFLTAQGYLPFAPPWSIPYLTNVLIAFQMLGCFLLLSSNLKTRRTVAGIFIFFHLYSVIIAGSRFAWSTFPFLVLLYMLQRDDDLSTSAESTLKAYFVSWYADIKRAAELTRGSVGALIGFLIALQALAFLDVVSEKRTFNMFSEATACVITMAASNRVTQYGHPIGSSACFSDQIIRRSKEELCGRLDDFDLRVEISKNGSNYKVANEKLSVCKGDAQSNYLPPMTEERRFKVQRFISPIRSDEKIELKLTGENEYEFLPASSSPSLKEYWSIARMQHPEETPLPNVEAGLIKVYQTLLILAWVAISIFLCYCLLKRKRP